MNHQFLSIQLANTIMDRYPNPDTYPYKSWCYCQGFVLLGFCRLYEDTRDPVYRNYILRYVDRHVLEDGTIDRFHGDNLDDMLPGAVLVWAYQETGKESYRKACDLIYASFKSYPRNREGGFWHNRIEFPKEMWVDGVFMDGMFLLAYAKAFPQYATDCYDELTNQLDCIFTLCHKWGGLLCHAHSENPSCGWADPVTGRSSEVWSEGLGWYTMVLTHTVCDLPELHPSYHRLRSRLQELLNTLCTLQGSDGLWYQVVDRPERPDNWTDTSGSAMFLYSMMEARQRIPSHPQQWDTAIAAGLNGLSSRIRPDRKGNLDVLGACDGVCVQMGYRQYVEYPRVPNAKEAVGAVLWAEERAERDSICQRNRESSRPI